MIRLVTTLTAVAIAIFLGGTTQASAQSADVSGAWAFEVTTDTGITTPSLTLEQDGEALTGHYSSEALGEVDVTGTMRGSAFTISFSANLQGQSVPVTYRGTLGDDGEISGTIDIADGALTGTFTATRSDR